MKKLLTTLALFVILITGCSMKGEIPVKPLPNFSAPDAVLEIKMTAPFGCLGDVEAPVGMFTEFEGLLPSQYEGRQSFAMWVFTKTNDLVLVRKDGKDEDTLETWFDYGRDLKPELYYPYADERIPGFPDICKSLKELRK